MQRLEEEIPKPVGVGIDFSPAANVEISSKIHEDEQKGYMRKVYGIVTLQLFITFSLAYLASLEPAFGRFCMHPATMIVSFIFLLAGMITALFCHNRVPYNYVALITFTTAMGLIVSACTATIDSNIVLTAIFVTLLMSVALTVFAWVAGEQAAVVSIILLLFGMFILEFLGLALIFTRSEWLMSFYCSGIALCYGCYLVIHTYIIREQGDVDDYIVAAIIIYLDIIRIFLYILAALAKKN